MAKAKTLYIVQNETEHFLEIFNTTEYNKWKREYQKDYLEDELVPDEGYIITEVVTKSERRLTMTFKDRVVKKFE